MTRNLKSAGLTATELKRRIPDVAGVAKDLYQIESRNGVARCPFSENHNHGDQDPSLRYDKKKHRLFCASQNCFGEKGADAITLVQKMERCGFPQATQRLADYYGVQLPTGKVPRPSSPNRSSTPQESPHNKQHISADAVRQDLLRQGYFAVAEYAYGGSLRKVRFEHQAKQQEDKKRAEKTFRWDHCADGVWCSGDGGLPKPLYVNGVFGERDQVGLAVGFEGEAKADIAGTLGLAGFSYKNITPEQAAALIGCEVVLWPDNDDSGKKQAESGARILADAGQTHSLKILVPPTEFPPAADIIDAVCDLGWDRWRVRQFLGTASAYIRTGPVGSIEESSSESTESKHAAGGGDCRWREPIQG